MFFKGKLRPVVEVERLAKEAMAPVDRLIELKLAGASERVRTALEWAQRGDTASAPQGDA